MFDKWIAMYQNEQFVVEFRASADRLHSQLFTVGKFNPITFDLPNGLTKDKVVEITKVTMQISRYEYNRVLENEKQLKGLPKDSVLESAQIELLKKSGTSDFSDHRRDAFNLVMGS